MSNAATSETAVRWGDAACRGTNPHLWFSYSLADIHAAYDICQTCPIVTQCAQEGLGRADNAGIWGGLTEWDRERIRRGRPPLRCPGCNRPLPRPHRGRNARSSNWCSTECHRAHLAQPCAAPGCGQLVDPDRKFCSQRCVGRSNIGTTRPRRVCATPGCDLTAAPHSTHCSPTCQAQP